MFARVELMGAGPRRKYDPFAVTHCKTLASTARCFCNDKQQVNNHDRERSLPLDSVQQAGPTGVNHAGPAGVRLTEFGDDRTELCSRA